MFEHVTGHGVDRILALMQEIRADPRPHKVDLVVGVYNDAEGNVPIMAAVKAAERHLVETETTKTYVGVAGDPEFRAFVPPLLLGDAAPQIRDGRIGSLQTPGGSGAMRVGFDLLKGSHPDTTVWVSTPTWSNHIPTAQDAGLKVEAYPYFRTEDRGLDFDGMINHLSAHAKPGDTLLLHACCHNPTGVDLTPEQWSIVGDLALECALLPFIDCAYQGLGVGLEADVAGLRIMAAKVPEMLVASSFSKNFGLYRERTGALSVMVADSEHLGPALDAAQGTIRTSYSMPPSHGARVVSTVFSDPDLRQTWETELAGMRVRIAEMRRSLRHLLEERQVAHDLSFLTDQKGMFSYTGFKPSDVERLRQEFAIYVADDGRINVAALAPRNLEPVADGFAAILR